MVNTYGKPTYLNKNKIKIEHLTWMWFFFKNKKLKARVTETLKSRLFGVLWEGQNWKET